MNWEYAELDSPTVTMLNNMGANGWELVTVVPQSINLVEHGFSAFFKRPL